MRLSIILFDGYTALDVVGGYEVLARLPGMEVDVVAERTGLVAADTRRLGLVAFRTLDEVEHTDVLYVPGGPGVDPMLARPDFLAHLARLHQGATWTVGICNGVALLGGAGILAGRTVAANWGWHERIRADYGATVVRDRYRQDGTLITSAGVSASIDAGLFLAGLIAGPELARLIQLGLEYYPDPPFGGTSAFDTPAADRDLVLDLDRRSVGLLARTPPAWA